MDEPPSWTRVRSVNDEEEPGYASLSQATPEQVSAPVGTTGNAPAAPEGEKALPVRPEQLVSAVARATRRPEPGQVTAD